MANNRLWFCRRRSAHFASPHLASRKDKPAELGLLPDGAAPDAATGDEAQAASQAKTVRYGAGRAIESKTLVGYRAYVWADDLRLSRHHGALIWTRTGVRDSVIARLR